MKRSSGRFIDPLTDFGFKRLFGTEPNKDILIDFLNQLFKGEKEITDLTYGPTEHQGNDDSAKKVFFDLLCTGKNGEYFIIEMQRADQRNFPERAVLYTSRIISNQLMKGEKYWNGELQEVYLIAILEFNLQLEAPGRYLRNASIFDSDLLEVFYKKLGFKFLELPKFVKTEDELENDLDRWCYLLKHMSELDQIPDVFQKAVFQKIFKIAEETKLSKVERAMYDSSLKARWDYENTIAFAAETAAQTAREQALEEGIQKGINQGAHINASKIALKMRQAGYNTKEINELTGLSIKEIEAL